MPDQKCSERSGRHTAQVTGIINAHPPAPPGRKNLEAAQKAEDGHAGQWQFMAKNCGVLSA